MTTSRGRRAAIVAGLDASGLTVAEHCRRHGVSPATFHRWRRELRAVRRPAFVEAIVEDGRPVAPAGSAPAAPTPVVEVRRWRVHVPCGFDAAELARLVLALDRLGGEPG